MPRAHPPLRREPLPDPRLRPAESSSRRGGARGRPAAPGTRAQAHFFGRQGEPGARERGAQGELETPARTRDRAEGSTRAGEEVTPGVPGVGFLGNKRKVRAEGPWVRSDPRIGTTWWSREGPVAPLLSARRSPAPSGRTPGTGVSVSLGLYVPHLQVSLCPSRQPRPRSQRFHYHWLENSNSVNKRAESRSQQVR